MQEGKVGDEGDQVDEHPRGTAGGESDHGSDDRELEEWTVKSKASPLRDEYDLDVVIAKAEVT